MSREEYLKVLRQKLNKLPNEEINAAIDFYNEYFDEAGEENTAEVIAKLGSPALVSSQILAEYAVKGLDNESSTAKKGLSAVWFIILAILASPIALPLLLLVVCLVFAVVLLCGSFLLTFFLLNVSLALAGIVSIVAGFAVITQHWQTSLFFIGIGLTASGIGILLFPPLVLVTKNISNSLAKWLKRLFDKITRRRKEGM
ncbi:DUF1700 domain-containing protein [Cytobacillus solani]|uniref:DUF1700 domain-containing protein n=1 Tax=Cytobacillus solani TaxID=1637975 RepID=A0A0Q3QK86_9BACI|nr:DUF1700 domain-containing protein [Cytobacillus solani]KOP70998.1 hypothetical protein AMS60_23360 [Bacillus sp. FJAT-21945]KQL18054.1 hypothetical protein AN957_05130 [Cytobacillus solani]USK55884.1 DUF1700 domain-containing protein [Cytobacillus solani]